MFRYGSNLNDTSEMVYHQQSRMNNSFACKEEDVSYSFKGYIDEIFIRVDNDDTEFQTMQENTRVLFCLDMEKIKEEKVFRHIL